MAYRRQGRASNRWRIQALSQSWVFETLSDWSIASYSTGTLAHSTNHTEGKYSLSVTNNQYTTVQSVPMAAPSAVGNWVAVDMYLPTPASQFYAGAVQAYVQIPSQNLYNAYLGQTELTGLPTNQWISLVYPIPASDQQQVLAAKNDLQLIFAINIPSGANSTYLIDNLRFENTCPDAGSDAGHNADADSHDASDANTDGETDAGHDADADSADGDAHDGEADAPSDALDATDVAETHDTLSDVSDTIDAVDAHDATSDALDSADTFDSASDVSDAVDGADIFEAASDVADAVDSHETQDGASDVAEVFDAIDATDSVSDTSDTVDSAIDVADATDISDTPTVTDTAIEVATDSSSDVADAVDDVVADTFDARLADVTDAVDAPEDSVEAEAEAPVSPTCGNGIVDSPLEDCDDGLGTSSAPNNLIRTCSSTCKAILTLLPVGDPSGAEFGTGRHTIASNSSGFGIVFQQESSRAVAMTTASSNGLVGNPVIDVTTPFASQLKVAFDANPVIAGLPDGSWAIAYNAYGDAGEVGVALVHVGTNSSVTFQGFVAQNNDLAQSDADIVWSAHDNLLYVTWADSSPTTAPAAMFQIFDSGFNALSAGATLSQSTEYAGDVTLAATANGIAFSYLHNDTSGANDANDGNEALTIIQGTTTYLSDAFAAGPANENPAISLVNGTLWATVGSQSNGQFSLNQMQFGAPFSYSLFALAQTGDEHSPLMGDQGLRCGFNRSAHLRLTR